MNITDENLGDDINIFNRSSKITRSPINTPLTTEKVLMQSTPINNTPRQQKGAKKRKLKDSPILDDNMKEYMDIVGKMCLRSETLNRLVKKHKNTQKDIQDVIKSLSYLAIEVRKIKHNLSFCDREADDLRSLSSDEEDLNTEIEEVGDESETNKEDSIEDSKKTEEKSYCEICKSEINAEKRITEEINNELSTTDDMNGAELATFVNKNWPEEVYKSTEMITGDLTKQPPDQAKVIIITTEEITRLSSIENNTIENITGQPGILRKMTRTYQPMKCEKRSSFTFLDEENEQIQSSNIFIVTVENILTDQNIVEHQRALTNCSGIFLSIERGKYPNN